MVRKTYKFFSDSNPDKEIARLIIEEDLGSETGHIEIYDEDLVPLDFILAINNQNNIKGVKCLLNDRVMPANRNFFSEYCESIGIDPNSIDDKLKICDGRVHTDDVFVKAEYENI